jgi:hypothetical protein
MLLTGGGCGLWAIIDLFTIAFGKFKDGNGDEIQSTIGIAVFVTVFFTVLTAVAISRESSREMARRLAEIAACRNQVAGLPETVLGPSLQESLKTTLTSLEEETRKLGFYRVGRLETHSLLIQLLQASLADKNLSDEEYEEWSGQYAGRFKANHNELKRLIQARKSTRPAPTATPIPEEDEI